MLDFLDSIFGPGWRYIVAGILATGGAAAIGHACALEASPDAPPLAAVDAGDPGLPLVIP